MPIRVLVVDDSAVMRGMLTEVINQQPDMKVVGVASDPYVAREKIKILNPDVLTLDVEMPRMDGLTFLERLMRLRPMPVIMVSSLTQQHAGVTLQALELGAVDFIAKPVGSAGLEGFGEEIAEKIRAAAVARIPLAQSGAGALRYPAAASLGPRAHASHDKLIVIGASTGGVDAIKDVLIRMPPDAPGILIVQHMPEMFTRMFADRLNTLCKIGVKEAEDGEPVRAGNAYVAPGDSHMEVARSGGYVIRLNRLPPVNRHRPAVDVLFRSAAACAGPNAIGVLMTGMGADGAEGMRELKKAGAYNLAQDEASCVVFGMPKAAIETGCVDKVSSAATMTMQILRRCADPEPE